MLCVVQLAIDLILNKFWIIFRLILLPLLHYILCNSHNRKLRQESHMTIQGL